jgi:hypothetical protein
MHKESQLGTSGVHAIQRRVEQQQQQQQQQHDQTSYPSSDQSGQSIARGANHKKGSTLKPPVVGSQPAGPNAAKQGPDTANLPTWESETRSPGYSAALLAASRLQDR